MGDVTSVPQPPVRVLLVDDDPLVRAGLSLMLRGSDELEVVGEAADGAEVEGAVARCSPDVVLMDIRMPGVDGITATEQLRRREGAPEVVVLTTFDDDRNVLRALRGGASGFLLKDTPPADIVRAVVVVARGEAVLSPGVTRTLLTHVGQSEQDDRAARAAAVLAGLTERERAVAVAVGEGRSNAEIGQALYLSVPTVKGHVSRILEKTRLTNRVQIALLAHDAGLV